MATGNTRVDVVELFNKVYGQDKARELWEACFKYYDEEIAYLSQFKGEKAAGVRGILQGDLQYMTLLADQASHVLNSPELAKQCNDILGRFNTMLYN